MSALCSTSSSATSATPASASYLRMLPSMSLPSGLRLGAPGEMGDDDCNGVVDEDNLARVSSQKQQQQQQEQPSRKNKRKNFQPRNIRVLDDEEVAEEAIVDCDSLKIRLPQATTASSASSPSPLDLSESAAAVTVASNSNSAMSALKRTLLWPVKVSCSAPTMSDHLNHLTSPQAIQTGNSDCSDPPREDEGEDEDDEDEEDDEDDRVRDVEAPRDPVDLTLKLDCDNGDMMDQDEDSGDEEFMGEEDAEEDSDGEGSEHQPTQLSEAEVQHSLWLLHNQYLAQQQQQPPNKSSHSNEASMQDYAESTMKELLSLYGLQRHDSAPLNHKVHPPSPHLEQKSRAEISRSVLASPRPSSIAVPQTNGSSSHHVGVASNPPTPPHTPKLDPSLAALQAHMQNVLRAAAQENHAHLTNSHGSSSGLLPPSAANLSLPRTNSLDRSCTFTPNMAAYMAMAASTSFAPPQQQLLMHGRRLEERGGGGGLYGGRKDSLLSGGGRLLSGGAKTVPIDYTRYVKRFSSALECGSHYCKDLNYREHFHCLDCNARVFVKKEEMIRHFKWHKKRDESLQHGFMRYSPMDDCSDRFRGCSHNRKQTHYHCLKDGCDKVYISTSDVQMHANYHRKDSAIIQEGFQRFRATEDCQTSYCAFNGQRTTHFHCRRGGCLYTFKNKADMEKHKTYHIKDEQLTKDGFKKFMKNETCTFEACRFSKVCNHIHCIRPGCNYVLHSSGQLYSHKRKHERRDNELAYRKYKLAQSVIKSLNGPGSSGASASADGANAFPPVVLSPATLAAFGEQFPYHSDSSLSESFSAGGAGPSTPPAVLPISFLSSEQQQQQQQSHLQFLYNSSRSISPSMLHSEAALERKLLPLSPGQPCPLQCELTCQEHWHCGEENCSTAFRSRDAALDHVRQHMQQEQITALCYVLAEPGQGDCPASCPMQARGKHYHCLWEGCGEVILPQDKPFRRLDHFKMHEYTRRMSLGVKESPSPSFVLHPGALGAAMAGACPQGFTLDSVFRRKRGRPPKNRVIEVWNECMSTAAGTADLPQAIFTSFKLPKPNSPPLPHFLSPASFAAVKAEPMCETSAAATNVTQTSSTAASPSRMSDSPLKGDAEAAGSGRDSFYPIPAGSVCPDPFCLLAGTSHFHCAHPRCCSALESASALGPHVQQLHSQQDILEGFVYFDRLVDCRLPTCTYNKQEGHFHCVRPACGLTFTKPSAMLSHEHCRDNKSNENGESGSPRPASASTSTEDNNSPKTVKAAGTFYPIPAFKPERSNSRDGSCSRSPSPSPSPVTTPSAKDVLQHHHRNQSPLALIKAGPSAQAMSQIEMPLLYGPASSCGRPFCKLKRREHYHCVVCNQAFSELERLQPHMLKHCSGALQWGNKEAEDSDMHLANSIASSSALASAQQRQQQVELLLNGPPESSSPLPLPPPPYMPPFGILPTHSISPSFLPPHLPPLYSSTPFSLPFGATPPQLLGSKRPSPSPTDLSPTDAKKLRFPTSMRILKDEPVPEGYIRYRFNEDCGYQQCGYREHQTHFHCMRPDCGYSFCDKTRFVQHTARHERLDTLMGGDFAQYRAAVPCGRSHCLYTAALGSVQNKASHFHCLKCDFVCTDTNKVVAHRRQHQKTDSILAAGFEKFTPAQACRGGAEACPHSTKQTHYHCLKCGYAVLGLSQMSAHKYRHMEGN